MSSTGRSRVRNGISVGAFRSALHELAGALTTVGRGIVVGVAVLSLTSCAVSTGVAAAETHITTAVTTNTTWTASGSPYLLEASASVAGGVTLTIEPGVTVEFKGDPTFGVGGTLRALGTSANPVTFTSSQGAAGEGAPGQYWGIIARGVGALVQLSHAHVYYGGAGSGGYYAYGALTTQEGAALEVDHSVFEHNEYSAVHLAGTGPSTISYSTLANNGDGISLTYTSVPPLVLRHSILANNIDFGLETLSIAASEKAPPYLYNNEITQNGYAGVYIEQYCSIEAASWPHGNRNDIYDNGPGGESPIDGRELDTNECEALPVDWSGNYWGDVEFIQGPEPLGKRVVCKTIPADWVQAASVQPSGYLAYSHSGKSESPNPGPISTADETVPVPAPCGEGTIYHHYVNNAFYLAPGEIETSYIPIATSSAPPSRPEPGVADSTASNPGAPGLKPQVRGDAVNSASGNETTAQTDLVVGGRGPGLNVMRSYNAQASATAQANGKAAGLWGWGWTGPYGAHLVFGTAETGQETVTVDQQNGSAIVFYKKEEGGGYEQGGWVQARLRKEGSDYIYTLPDQTVLEFAGEGKLLKEVDRNGNATTVKYNSSKQIENVTDSSGRTLTFNYNGEGLVESIKDPLGHLVSYTYVAKGGLSTVTIEGKVRWEFEYTATAPYLLKGMTDGRKHTITREYDSSNRVIKEIIGGHERKWSYGTNHTTITEPNGAVTVSTFNIAKEPTRIVEAAGTGLERITNCEYNGRTYNLTQLIDPNKHATKYGYDGDGNRILEIDPSGDEHKWEYDNAHNVVKETTPEGEVTTTTLTKTGNPEVVNRPVGSETQQTKYTYDAYGDVTEVIDPLGGHTKYTYDAHGDKESETDPEGNKRKWTYNEDSQVIEEVSPRGYITKTERNGYGLPTTVTDPLGHTTEFKYDGNQNVVSETDGAKHTTEYEYNAEDLPITIIKPNSDTINIGYDVEGEETSFTDGNGKTWEAKRNLLEQVTEEKNPLGKTWKKTYEPVGNLEKREDPKGHATEYLYDASSRLEKVKYSYSGPHEGWESPNVTYEYNKDGKVTKMRDETAGFVNTTEYTWDLLGRLTKYTNDEGETLHYEYDLANLPTKIIYPNGKSVTREYDKDKRLIKVTDWQGREFSFNYDADSKLTATIFPSSSKDKDEYAYSKADQLTEVNMLWGLTSYAKLSYERDGDGQVTKVTEILGTPFAKKEVVRQSGLDENNRLIEENKHAYAYDKANNPTTIEGEAGYSYNEADQLKEGPTAKYTYNEAGQRTELIPKNGEHATTYEYNRAGLPLLIYRQSGPKQAEIEDWLYYDGSGLLLSENAERGSRGFVWDAAEPIPVLLSENLYGSGERDYVYGPENLPLEEIFGSSTRYLHHDQQGSTRALTSGSEGTPTKWTVYSPYGRIIETEGTGTISSLGYDGQFTNPETSLISVGARNYDPSTAQFISMGPAPVLESTGEPYVFSQDNPENVRTVPIGGAGYTSALGMTPGQP